MPTTLYRIGVYASFAALLFLGGCGSSTVNRAPVEDRAVSAAKPAPVAPVVKPPPGIENAGKPGYYSVKPGDTLIRIGLENGQSYKDITRWNALENPNKIEAGQVLRVVPPVPADTVAVARPVSSSVATTTAIPPVAPASARAASAPASAPAVVASAASPAGDEDLGWIWPGKGPVLADFDEAKNKGLDIGGVLGDPVLAAAEGKVVYAGAGLRGYGNLVILKHNSTFLTAYAHNHVLLVKEDQTVKKGQKIAEMGNSDADRIKLHFEIRRLGKPVDPAKYLPTR